MIIDPARGVRHPQPVAGGVVLELQIGGRLSHAVRAEVDGAAEVVAVVGEGGRSAARVPDLLDRVVGVVEVSGRRGLFRALRGVEPAVSVVTLRRYLLDAARLRALPGLRDVVEGVVSGRYRRVGGLVRVGGEGLRL